MAWEQLDAVYRGALELARVERSQPPVSCPNDAQPLTSGPHGELFCRFDGWTWPRDARSTTR